MKEKYSMLTPLSFEYMNRHHKSVWKFRCDCGNFKVCVLSDVKSKRTQSCGCLHKMTCIQNGFLRTITLENTKFEGFEVLNRNTDKSFKNHYGAYYICKCKCGNFFERMGKNILSKNKNTKRCSECQYKHNGNKMIESMKKRRTKGIH